MLRSVVVEKRKKSVDKNLPSKKVYSQTSSLLSKNTRTTQEITRNDRSMPFWWTATHDRGDTKLLFRRKKGKNFFPNFRHFQAFNQFASCARDVKHFIKRSHRLCTAPVQISTQNNTFLVHLEKGKKVYLLINKSYRKMAKSSMKTVSHSLMMEWLSPHF